jgi:hypothetical protein
MEKDFLASVSTCRTGAPSYPGTPRNKGASNFVSHSRGITASRKHENRTSDDAERALNSKELSYSREGMAPSVAKHLAHHLPLIFNQLEALNRVSAYRHLEACPTGLYLLEGVLQ